MNVSNVGSHVTLLFQSKYQTFTPAQFVKTFQEQGFVATKGNANISSNPLAPAVPTNIFSKDNLIVLFNPSENLIIFQIINTVDFNDIYEKEIQKILISLNFDPSSVGMLGLDAVTQVHDVKSPIDSLTSLTNKKFIDGLNQIEIGEKMKVTSLRFTSRDSDKESIGVTLEPLQTDPTGSYHMIMVYRTKENDKFNEFIKLFGTNMVEKIIKEVEKNV